MAARKSGSSGRAKEYREFVAEAEDILERVRESLTDLAEGSESGDVNPDLVNELFRAAHSLKGLCGMFGLDAPAELAHHLEDILHRLRMGRVSLGPLILGPLEEGVALFGRVLESLAHGSPTEEETQAIADLITRLANAGATPTHAPDPLARVDMDPTLLRALTEYEEHRLRDNLARGRRVHVVEASFEILAFEEGLGDLSTGLREECELISTLPSPGEVPDSEIHFSMLVATDLDADELTSHLDTPGASITTVSSGAGTPLSSPGEEPPVRELNRSLAPSSAEEAEPESLRSISQTVRVDVSRLDSLMNLVGEVAIQRSAIEKLSAQLSKDRATIRAGAELAKIHKALERKLQDLQSAVLEVRMVPLRQIFEKLSRVIRRLQRKLGKQVRLDLRGEDTELDKLIVEDLVDPLNHLIRNAFDHGIESPEARNAALKPSEGCIRIEAFQRGNHVVIQVADDGRGIDLEAVRAKAQRGGLVQPGEALTRKETLDLIFAPGLTTRREVTATSGRGVGLDVVKANVTALGGIVEVESEPGKGTTINLTLPSTLAMIQALVVGVGDQRFAIPLNSVLEVLLVEAAEVEAWKQPGLMSLRGEPLPLRWLSEEVASPESAQEDKRYVVVLGLGETRLGLVVECLEGQHDTVIKPIQGPIAALPGIAGATEFGDGRAVLVLDVAALAPDVLRGREAA